jgi:hypothetical protein
MFYLNRGGAPEGPFEEGRILHMIASGELTRAGVCPVGQNQWWSLEQVPVFAQALAQRAAGLAGYGYAPPPTAPGYGPPPTAAGYGPPPTAPGYGPGPTAGGYGAAAPATSATQAGRRTIPEEKKAGRGLLIGGLVVVLLIFLGGSALGAYLLFFAGGGAAKISATIPRDSELFVEAGSLPKLLLDLKEVEYLDTSMRDDKKLFDDSADSVAKAFDISLDDARALLGSSQTFGLAGRRLSTSPEAAVVIGFRSGSAVEALLKSTRFIASGALAQTGKRYQLTKKVLQSSVGQDVLLKSLADAELGRGKQVLVWFPQQKLLSFGDETLITDLAKVVESGAASIETNPSFQAAAKDFDPSARLTVFLDPGVFSGIAEPKLREFVDGYFKPAGPLTGMLTVKPAGFVTSLTGRIMGTKLPKAASYQAAQKLELPPRLAAETFAYAAFQTQTKLTGLDIEKLLFDQLQAAEPRSKPEVERGLAQLEQLLGVSVSKLFDGLGSEGVLALAAPADFSLDLGALSATPQAAAKLNITWVQALKDDSEYKRLAAQLKQKLLPTVREVTLTEDGPGFALVPRGAPLPVSLRVKFFDKFLFITAGGNLLCDRAEAAFAKGDRSLKDDAAHGSALAALPDTAHFRLWIDSGRLAETLLKNPLLRARAAEAGFQLDKFRLTGPQRVTSAISLRGEVENEVWTYRLDALNAQAMAPLGLGAALLGGGFGRGIGGGSSSALPPL